LSYDWPGNVRELENVLERAYILESTFRISAQHVPFEILNTAEKHVAVAMPVGGTKTLAAARSEAVAAAERRYLIELLTTHQGRIDASAQTAGITTRQLRKLLAKYEIRKTDFKPVRPSRQEHSTRTESQAHGGKPAGDPAPGSGL
jgi:DNA-binding NtrC family response regulator